jgi:vacuolar protein sorting-associated protein 13A/C
MDGIVRPYSQREALGQFWLKTADDGKYFNEDYIAHLELPGRDMIVILTYDRIVLVRSHKLRTEWDIKLTDIQTISKERTGMSITLKGGTNGPFIPIQDEASRNWLYRQIAVGTCIDFLSFSASFSFSLMASTVIEDRLLTRS